MSVKYAARICKYVVVDRDGNVLYSAKSRPEAVAMMKEACK